MSRIEPEFSYDRSGYDYIGRGPGGGGSGWSRSPSVAYRCVKCGDVMRADCADFFACACGAMRLDIDSGRFGSRLGDENILVYKKRP
jgi:hypothetical protein